MNKGLWTVQILLGMAFVMGGGMKLVTSVEVLAADMVWVTHVPALAVKGIGFVELLGACGLILPSLLRIKPWLTSLAALGLLLTMLGATATHIALGESNMIVAPLVLGCLAAFVAWGRYKVAPIEAA